MDYINLLSESSYVETTWYKRIISGIRNELNPRRDVIRNLSQDDIGRLQADSVLLIIGFSKKFLSESIDLCTASRIKPLIIGSSINGSTGQQISCVTTERDRAMYENVCSLFNSGCRHIAMIGVNPSVSTDLSHKAGYCQAVSEHGFSDFDQDIFYNSLGLGKAIDAFLRVRHVYDAVVCTNDYVAVVLLSHLRKLGVKVPEEISVTGAGNTDSCRWTEPTLTSIDIPLESAGKNAVILYRILAANPGLNSLNSTFGYNIVYRDSTKVTEQDRVINRSGHEAYAPLLSSDYENAMRPIWNLTNTYSMIDETDRRIIGGILRNLSNSELAEEVYISESTLRYRLSKLYEATGVSGKSELKALLGKYFPNYRS